MKGEIRFQTSKLVMKSTVFWGVVPCTTVKVYSRFGRTYHLSLGRRVNWPNTYDILLARLTFRPWKWKRYIPLKKLLYTKLHGATSQKILIFLRTSIPKTFLQTAAWIHYFYFYTVRPGPELSEPKTPISPNALPATWWKPYQLIRWQSVLQVSPRN
jgi:hypothetical protein